MERKRILGPKDLIRIKDREHAEKIMKHFQDTVGVKEENMYGEPSLFISMGLDGYGEDLCWRYNKNDKTLQFGNYYWYINNGYTEVELILNDDTQPERPIVVDEIPIRSLTEDQLEIEKQKKVFFTSAHETKQLSAMWDKYDDWG